MHESHHINYRYDFFQTRISTVYIVNKKTSNPAKILSIVFKNHPPCGYLNAVFNRIGWIHFFQSQFFREFCVQWSHLKTKKLVWAFLKNVKKRSKIVKKLSNGGKICKLDSLVDQYLLRFYSSTVHWVAANNCIEITWNGTIILNGLAVMLCPSQIEQLSYKISKGGGTLFTWGPKGDPFAKGGGTLCTWWPKGGHFMAHEATGYFK